MVDSSWSCVYNVYTLITNLNNMATKLQKWGNSLGVRLPKEVVKKAKLKDGKNVSIKNIGNSIVITASSEEETFESLLSKITPQNRYEELDWGPAVGNEVW